MRIRRRGDGGDEFGMSQLKQRNVFIKKCVATVSLGLLLGLGLIIIDEVIDSHRRKEPAALRAEAVSAARHFAYEKAESLLLQSLAIYKDRFGEDDREYIGCLSDLAEVYRLSGEFDKAEPIAEQLLKRTERKRGVDHPTYAIYANRLGLIYHAKGKISLAKLLFEKAVAIGPEDAKEYPGYLNNLALAFLSLGDLDQAEHLYLQSLELSISRNEEREDDYARVLSNLGVVYFLQGNYEQAESVLLDALAITDLAVGKNHPSYAMHLSTLGLVYTEQENFHKAESSLLESTATYENLVGKRHPQYMSALKSLGRMYLLLGDLDIAEPILDDVLELNEATFGKQHRSYAHTLTLLGLLNFRRDDSASAESLLLQALSILESATGINHRNYALALIVLGSVYESQVAYELAEQHFEQALATFDAVLPSGHPLIQDAAFRYADLLWKMDRIDESDQLIETYELGGFEEIP